MNEIILDTETTGLSIEKGDRIIEIACVETKDLIPTKKVFYELTFFKISRINFRTIREW